MKPKQMCQFLQQSQQSHLKKKKTPMLAFLSKIKHQIQFSISIYLMNESFG